VLPAGFAIWSVAPAWAQPERAVEPAATVPAPQPTVTGAPAAAGTTPAAADTKAGAGAAGQAPPVAPPPTDSLSPMRLMDGPSLRETGRIAVAPTPMPFGGIENDATPSTAPKEKSIARAASAIDAAPAPRPTGVIDQRVLDREITEHFQEIGGCRVEVARMKQVTPAQIVADKILLRWIIEPDGSTGSTDVVAILPVDLGIMDCAKRVMSQWTFTRPRGGPMTVERRFTFY
jgi:hypothetical protein